MHLRFWKRSGTTSAMWCCVVFAAVLGTSPAMAINPELSLSQLGHLAWRVQDGVLPGTPTAIAQTSDGYLWIGTQAGLVRFDGATFAPAEPPPDQASRNSRIAALHAGRDGNLWIGTGSQLIRWKSGRFHLYRSPDGMYSAFGEAPDGRIWASRSRVSDDLGPLCELQESRIDCYGPKQGVPLKLGVALAVEGSGAIWIAAPEKLARWQGGKAQIYTPAELSRDEGLDGFSALAVGPDGSMWSGVLNGGPGLGLQHLVNGVWGPVISRGVDTSTWEVSTLLFDRDRALWVGSESHGIYRISGSRIDHFGVGDGLSADTVVGLCEDHEGNIWVATTKGVDKFRPTQVVTVSSREGLTADGVDAVLASKSGAVWVSNTSALERIDNGVVTSFKQGNGLPGRFPTAMFEDAQGKFWVGVENGVAVFDGKHFTQVRSAQGPIGAIGEFAQGADSTVWGMSALVPSRLVRMNSAEVLESIPAPAGTRIGTVATGPAGELWVGLHNETDACDLARYIGGSWDRISLHNPAVSGTCSQIVVKDGHTVFASEPRGIVEWHDGVVRTLTSESGLPCAHTYSITFDRHQDLWVYLQCGVAVIESRQLADWWNNPAKKQHIHLLDVSDGALPMQSDFHPRSSVGMDGKIWFANSTYLQFVDPTHWLRNTVVPPVHIEGLEGDGRVYPLRSPVTLPPLTRNLQIDFTALSFSVPQKVQFKYRLSGWDTDWQNPGRRRQAFYTNLKPGLYRFSVLASNDDGLWNTQGDSLEFRIQPAFYQTWWFRLVCIVAAVALIHCAYLLALRRAKVNIRQRLAARLSERERIARELHDTLLQSIQGLMMKFHAVSNSLPADSAGRTRLDGILSQGSEVIAEGRARVRDLRGSDTASTELTEQLNAYGVSFEGLSPTAFITSVIGQTMPLNPVVSDELLQIAREAIANAFAHAEAKRIEVEVTYGLKAFVLRIRDDGKGIAKEIIDSGRPDHWGILGMRERAKALGGKFNIWSQVGAGTEIDLTVPGTTAYAAREDQDRDGFSVSLRRLIGL